MNDRGWALVTGGARRIGQALALAAARCGYDVLVHYRRGADEAESTAGLVRACGRHAAIYHADFLKDGACERLVAAAPGPLTLLVNSASLFSDDRVGALTTNGLDTHFATNVRAPVLLAQAFAAALPADRRGLIVNIVDQRVWRLTPQYVSYTLSKAALWAATQTLAQALAPTIRVNAIGPGPTAANIYQSDGDFAAEAAGVPLGHGATPDEIGAALVYLIDAPSVTGQMIAVDGGQHLAWKTPDIIGD